MCALQWARCVDTADEQLAEAVDPGAVHRLRYEDLVTDPEHEVGRLAEFLRVPPPDALPDVRADSAGGWRERLREPELAGVRAIAGTTLARYGYS